jgi:hypothetical protein
MTRRRRPRRNPYEQSGPLDPVALACLVGVLLLALMVAGAILRACANGTGGGRAVIVEPIPREE